MTSNPASVGLKPFCHACQSIPAHGYCRLKDCPMPHPDNPQCSITAVGEPASVGPAPDGEGIGLPREAILDRIEFDTNGGCWLWTGAITEQGYAQVRVQGRHTKAHRASYEAFKGLIPAGKLIMHSCDVRCCVNPDHLSAGSVRDNNYDRSVKGRSAAKLSFEDVERIYASDDPSREVARAFGIAPSMVRHIRNGTKWSNITGHSGKGSQQ